MVGKGRAAFRRLGRPRPIGLTSLDLAALVAKLQRHWKIDPFLEVKTITEVRTVGDFCQAYRECIGPA